MSAAVTGRWAVRRTDLDPEWARAERPWLYYWCLGDPLDVLDVDTEDLPGEGERCARELWASAYGAALPLAHQDVTYGEDWRGASDADLAAGRAGSAALDWAVRLPRGQVDRHGSYDAARRRGDWPLLCRDVIEGPWVEVVA